MTRRLLTTLAEDLQAIGLVAPVPPKKEEPQGAGDGGAKKTDDIVDEAKRLVKTKRKSSAEKAAAKRAYRKVRSKKLRASKQYRKSAAGKKSMKRTAAWHAKHGPSKKGYRLASGVEGVDNLAEAAKSLVTSLDITKADEVARNFAQLALAADLLSQNLKEASDAYNEKIYSELSEQVSELAEQMAEIAKAVHEGEEYDEDLTLEAFKEGLEDFTESLSIFDTILQEEDMQEGDDMDDEDEEEDDEEDEEDDEGNCD